MLGSGEKTLLSHGFVICRRLPIQLLAEAPFACPAAFVFCLHASSVAKTDVFWLSRRSMPLQRCGMVDASPNGNITVKAAICAADKPMLADTLLPCCNKAVLERMKPMRRIARIVPYNRQVLPAL